jgi:hypothetical protein
VIRQMQYFQYPKTKQILGRSKAPESCAFDDPELVEASAGATVRGISAIATATSILFMTISLEGHPFSALCRPST